MFIEPQTDTLRQGDVIEQVWFTPATFYKVKDEQFTLPQTTIRHSYLVIVSHCCELTWFTDAQGISQPRRPYILIAPLSLKIPFIENSIEYRMLVENGINHPENDPVQYFYFENNNVIHSESVIDFSTIIPIRSGTLRNLELKSCLPLLL